MGCCASRPAEDLQPGAPSPTSPRRTTSQHPTTSETAINPTSSIPASTQQRRTSLLQPQTSRQSDDSSLPSNQPVSLADHYNLPLLAPRPWASKSRCWTPASLRRERYEFFETRVTGHREVWAALRQVAECVREGDIPTAQGILDAVGVTLPTGRLEEGGYDQGGNLYRLPAAVLSDPSNIEPDADEGDVEETATLQTAESRPEAKVLDDDELEKDVVTTSPEKVDKGKAPLERDAVKVKCRLSDRGGPDVVVAVGKSTNVAALVRMVRDDSEIPSQARVRVAYLGRILDERKSLADQGWKEGQVVNVLITGVYAS